MIYLAIILYIFGAVLAYMSQEALTDYMGNNHIAIFFTIIWPVLVLSMIISYVINFISDINYKRKN